jgi:hypothetical protein
MSYVTAEEYERYMNAAQSAMFQFQLIEEGLKAYLWMINEIIRSSIPDKIDFNVPHSEIDSMPLERLLNVFGKHTKNRALLKQLNRLRASRNHVAHKAFVLAFYCTFETGVDFHSELATLESARDESAKAFLELKEELDMLESLKTAGPRAPSGA